MLSDIRLGLLLKGEVANGAQGGFSQYWLPMCIYVKLVEKKN